MTLTDDELGMVERLLSEHTFDESQEANWLASKANRMLAEIREHRTRTAPAGLTQEEREILLSVRKSAQERYEHTTEMIREEERVTEVERLEMRLKIERRLRDLCDRLLASTVPALIPSTSTPEKQGGAK